MGGGIISTWQSILNGFDFSYLLQLLLGVIPALICITIHEFCHGVTAFYLGDDTAKNMGRLSLNPIRHLDPVGFFMLIVFHFGWAKPVPVNMMKFKRPKRGMALTALAGPASNLVLTLLLLFLYGMLYRTLNSSVFDGYLLDLIHLTSYMSLGLAIFNMLPIPPLDGSKILFSIIRDEHYQKLMFFERYGSILLLLLAFTGILGKPLGTLISRIYDALFVVAQTAYRMFS